MDIYIMIYCILYIYRVFLKQATIVYLRVLWTRTKDKHYKIYILGPTVFAASPLYTSEFENNLIMFSSKRRKL
jgi:hypothetical protein